MEARRLTFTRSGYERLASPTAGALPIPSPTTYCTAPIVRKPMPSRSLTLMFVPLLAMVLIWGTSARPAPASAGQEPVCLQGEGFFSSGNMGTYGEPGGDATQVLGYRWAPHDGCERLVIDLGDATGQPAQQAGEVQAQFHRDYGLVRLILPPEFQPEAMDEEAMDIEVNGLVDRAYTVLSLEGRMFIDIYLGTDGVVPAFGTSIEPALARVIVLDAPARIVVDLQPGGRDYPLELSAADNIAVMLPQPGEAQYPVTITGYARTFEANVLARLYVDGQVQHEDFTTAASWAPWGVFAMTIEQGPTGDVELFVGELSARDGTEQGVRIPLTIGDANNDDEGVAVCLQGEGFFSSGLMGTYGQPGGDATEVLEYRWADHEACERLVIDLADATGQPAQQAGEVEAQFHRDYGMVRLILPPEFGLTALEEASDVQIGGLVDRAYTVWTLDGRMIIDIYLGEPALARVIVLDAPARIVVDVHPGGRDYPLELSTADNIAVMLPQPGEAQYPITITGYARTFEANVLARLYANGQVEVEDFTTAAAWAETWGVFAMTIDQGPTGNVELFVGELSARDGTEQGVRIPLTIGDGEPLTFRDFAGQLDQALREGNIDFVSERLLAFEYTCTADDLNGGPGGPVCDFEGQTFDGFREAIWRSHGYLVPVENAAQNLNEFITSVLPNETDEFGTGAPQVYALGPDPDPYQTVVTALVERPADVGGQGPLRVAYVIDWVEADGLWLAEQVLIAEVLAEDFLEPTSAGENYVEGWEPFE
jgi:hypothetical protein